MSYQVLARKWRPKKFQDVIGQAHVTRALQNAILNDKIGHAYMLVGTRGVGKTSVARIFAKSIRCENHTPEGNACGECRACLDFDTETSMNVTEIDGASNNSVDNIRELISNVQYLPTNGRFRIYIIDEVHMLSTSAFNALLKTLEEPPSHIVFIFATTEPQKLLGTVLSRCQRFDFRNVSVKDLASHVREIAKEEKIKFESDSLMLHLATLGRGSVRDTLSLLDQVLIFSRDNNITEEGLTSSLGVAGPSSIKALQNAIYNGNTTALTKIYNKLLEENVPAKNIGSSLLDEFYFDIKNYKEISEAELIWIYENIARETTWIFESIAPEKSFEVVLTKVALRRTFFSNKMPTPQSDAVEEINVEKKNEEIAVPKIERDLSWDGFLAFLAAKSPASASNLEQGNLISPLRLENDELHIELGFGFAGEVFHDYLSEAEVYQKLVANLSEFFYVEKNKIFLELKAVQNQENFVSKAEIREQQAEITHQERVENFKKNPMLKEAEKIFNAKVDKIIIDQKK